MSREDRFRWNQRYRNAPPGWYDCPREILVQQLSSLPKCGLALDVAMGMGANARYLMEKGWRVVGLDSSDYAVRKAKQQSPALDAVIIDLDHVHLAARRFDLILNLYFLNRRLLIQYPAWLKPGGILIMECLTLDMLSVRPDLQPDHLIKPGELLDHFGSWEILYHRSGWFTSEHGHEKAIESLIARLPD